MDVQNNIRGVPLTAVSAGNHTPAQVRIALNNQHESGEPVFMQGDEIVEMGDDFDFDGFQVVRREFFAHLSEPAVSFNNCKFYVNTACINKFPDTNYVQVLVNRETKILALRPCSEGSRDSFAWCSTRGKRKPKQITCKLFFCMVMQMMEWNPDFRYKLLGKLIHANGEYLLAFDLTSTEVYEKTYPEGAKPKTSRKPVYPSSWKDQFGLSFKDHQQSMQVNIFDGYAVYSIKNAEQSENGLDAETAVTSTACTDSRHADIGGMPNV